MSIRIIRLAFRSLLRNRRRSLVTLAAVAEPLGRELADRLEQAEPRLAASLLDEHERPLDEPCEGIKNISGQWAVVSGQ